VDDREAETYSTPPAETAAARESMARGMPALFASVFVAVVVVAALVLVVRYLSDAGARSDSPRTRVVRASGRGRRGGRGRADEARGGLHRHLRRRLRDVAGATVTVAVYAAIALVVGLLFGWAAGLVFAFFAALVLVIGYGAIVGGQWLRDVSAGRSATGAGRTDGAFAPLHRS
jgi:membrane protein implicated in regulation of membrane protease activity